MSNRITQKDLEAVVRRINDITGNNPEPYTQNEDGSFAGGANIGTYTISYAYGGVALHQADNKGGGVRDIFGGHGPKRELYEKMQAYISGLLAKG